jgi:hypothetical protein
MCFFLGDVASIPPSTSATSNAAAAADSATASVPTVAWSVDSDSRKKGPIIVAFCMWKIYVFDLYNFAL